MKGLFLLLLLTGCSARLGNDPNPRASCQTAGWYVDGPRQIARYREVTYRVVKCSDTFQSGQIMWSVSDGAVLRILSSSSQSARIRALDYGGADVVAVGPSGQFTLFVTVE